MALKIIARAIRLFFALRASSWELCGVPLKQASCAGGLPMHARDPWCSSGPGGRDGGHAGRKPLKLPHWESFFSSLPAPSPAPPPSFFSSLPAPSPAPPPSFLSPLSSPSSAPPPSFFSSLPAPSPAPPPSFLSPLSSPSPAPPPSSFSSLLAPPRSLPVVRSPAQETSSPPPPLSGPPPPKEARVI